MTCWPSRCSGWNNTVKGVCGDFSDPTNPDLGQCHPYRTKRTCEAPDINPLSCYDPNISIQTNPTKQTPFIITSSLFDQSCNAILDQDGSYILTQTAQ